MRACGLTRRPYLLQHVHRVPAALHPGGEAGRGRGIVILGRLREELGHRYLIRHPSAGEGGRVGNAHGRVCDDRSETQNHVRPGGGGEAAGDGSESRFSPRKLWKCSLGVFSGGFTAPQGPWEEGTVSVSAGCGLFLPSADV